MQLTDGMLVQRCLNGDKEAFGFLVDRYKEAVFGLAYSKVGNIHDAQDIAQEAFLNAYKNLRQFRHPYKFHSWLYAITANCCKMFFRKRAKERKYRLTRQ
ncbi:MAG: RNA polymerase sigma factor [Candidatus Poribacteria bacterium]